MGKELVQKRTFVSIIFGLSLIIFLIISYISYKNTQLLRFNTQQALHSNENLLAYESFFSIVKDAETGQRGYLMTGDSTYLQPYTTAIASVDSLITRVYQSIPTEDSLRRAGLHKVGKLVRRRLFLLESNIRRRRVLGLEAALQSLQEGQGRVVMDSLRAEVRYLITSEQQLLSERSRLVEESSDRATFTRIAGSTVSILLLIWSFVIMLRQISKRQAALALVQQANEELERRVESRTRELQKLTEELATSNEELQVTTEELTASNEEITASNEALAANNERLNTLIGQLHETRRQLQLALESARMGSWNWNVQTDTVTWSEGLEEVHGLVKGEFRSAYGGSFEGYKRFIYPDDVQRWQEEIERSLRNRTVYDMEFRIVRSDGQIRWVLARGIGEYAPSGEPLSMVGVEMDITERKLAEARLRESEAKLRRMFESDMMGVLYWQRSGEIIEANEKFLRLLGYDQNDVRQCRLNVGTLTPPEWNAVDEWIFKELSEKGVCEPFEKEFYRRDGSRVPVLVGGATFEGKNDQGVAFVLDITEQKEAEARLKESESKMRRLFEVGLLGVYFWRTDGTITEANEYFLNLVGYTADDLARGLVNWRRLTPGTYEAADEQALQQILQMGFCQPYEKVYIARDGRLVNVLIGKALLEGKEEEGIAFLLDITERKCAEEQLSKSQKLLQTIFEASADALFLLEAHTHVIEDCNQQAVELFEFSSKDELIGHKGPVLQSDPFSVEERRTIVREIRKNNYWSNEVEYLSRKGNRFWGNVAVSFFSLEEKDYYLVRIRDVTERHEIYEAVKRSQLELLEEKRKTELQLAIIEEDNARKTKELEEARDLQLSMLPQTVPQLKGCDIASFMKTCVEVGGDYYDYKTEEDGTLTIIVGDATGHGLKAGIIVATVKSYFQSLAGNTSVVELLQRISEGIRNLQIRAMYMGVTVVQIREGVMHIAASGMPPLYMYHHRTQQVEKITLTGPFLGSALPMPYHHVSRTLQPGDSLMIMTDGLPELFNPQRQMLDYEPIESAYRESAPASAQEVIDSLVKLADRWSEGLPNQDDITLVALKMQE